MGAVAWGDHCGAHCGPWWYGLICLGAFAVASGGMFLLTRAGHIRRKRLGRRSRRTR